MDKRSRCFQDGFLEPHVISGLNNLRGVNCFNPLFRSCCFGCPRFLAPHASVPKMSVNQRDFPTQWSVFWRFPMRTYLYLSFLFVFFLLFLFSCTPYISSNDMSLSSTPTAPVASAPEYGGSEVADLVIDLPTFSGDTLYCYQGVGGSYSHQQTSTWYDLDLD